MKLIFLGTPYFAVPVLSELIEKGHEVSLVVTQPDRAGNRGKVTFSPVKEKALSEGIEVLQPENVNDESVLEVIREKEPDAAIVVAYGQILKKGFLSIPKYGTFNVHGSLLPRLRGASPIQRSILDGDTLSGVTIMKVEEGLDSGDILIQDSTPTDHKNFEELHDELALMGASLMTEALDLIESGSASFKKQDDDEATYASLIKKSDGKMDMNSSAIDLDRKIRAFDPWPGAFADLDGKTVKIWRAAADEASSGKEPGTIIKAGPDTIDIACGEGVLKVSELQAQGRKRMSAKDFLLGNKLEVGDILK